MGYINPSLAQYAGGLWSGIMDTKSNVLQQAGAVLKLQDLMEERAASSEIKSLYEAKGTPTLEDVMNVYMKHGRVNDAISMYNAKSYRDSIRYQTLNMGLGMVRSAIPYGKGAVEKALTSLKKFKTFQGLLDDVTADDLSLDQDSGEIKVKNLKNPETGEYIGTAVIPPGPNGLRNIRIIGPKKPVGAASQIGKIGEDVYGRENWRAMSPSERIQALKSIRDLTKSPNSSSKKIFSMPSQAVVDDEGNVVVPVLNQASGEIKWERSPGRKPSSATVPIERWAAEKALTRCRESAECRLLDADKQSVLLEKWAREYMDMAGSGVEAPRAPEEGELSPDGNKVMYNGEWHTIVRSESGDYIRVGNKKFYIKEGE